MSAPPAIPRYGVKMQTPEGDDVARAAEKLSLVGYTLLDSGLDREQQATIKAAFEVAKRSSEQQFGRHALEAIDEHNTIRSPLIYSDTLLALAQNNPVLRLCEMVFGSAFVLNQQNGVINPPRARYNQGSWHRDLPYQHFTASRPIAINALYCIDPFTNENGCTKVIAGSHKQEAFPSDEAIREMAIGVEAPAGTFLVLDCMTFHSGGDNRTPDPRRAINHVYTLPFIKQQISFEPFANARQLPENTRRLLAIDDGPAADVGAYLARRRAKLQPN